MSGKPRKKSPATAKATTKATAKPAPRKKRARKAAAPDLTRVAVAVDEQLVKAAIEATPKSKRKGPPASRKNKKGLVLYVDPAVPVALRRLALDTGMSVQELAMEALNGLFRRHDMPEFPVDQPKAH